MSKSNSEFTTGMNEQEQKKFDEEVAKRVAEKATKKSYVDPSGMNGRKQTPRAKDRTEKGRQAFRRLRGEGRI